MKKLIINTLLFLIPIVIFIIVLPIDKRLKYQGLKDDCFNHGIWIYDRIYNNDKPIDIAFMGSSHTVNGIDDKLISENIQLGEAVNLGYCRLGRNLSYVLLKDLIAEKKIKHLILEVLEDEDRYSHPIFPYISSTYDVLLPTPFFNRDIISDLWTHFVYKTEILQDIIYQQEQRVPFRSEEYGFTTSTDTASVEYLDAIALERSKTEPPMSKFERDFHMNFARTYLSKIYNICKGNNIQITFLYIPAYGSLIDKPKEFETYSKYGKVLIAPKQILNNKNNWYDKGHLNQAGARALSLWLIDQMNDINTK